MVAKQAHPLLRDRSGGLSTVAARMLRKAAAAMSRGELNTAAAMLNNVFALAPGHPEALRMLGVLHHFRGHLAESVSALREALAAKPGDALTMMNLATTLHEHGHVEEAMSLLQRACALVPDFAPAWYNFGKMLRIQGRHSRAITALHRAVDLDPQHVSARVMLANVQASLGAMTPAATSFREALQRAPGHADAWMGLAQLHAETLTSDDVSQLRQALQAASVVHERTTLGFALAHALEDTGLHAEAFDTLEQANALKRQRVDWDARAAHAHTESILQAFTRPARGATEARLGEEVVFLVGLPRSASTLVEQILGAHPQIALMDKPIALMQILDEESTRRRQPFPQWVATTKPADWTRMGADYLARTEHRRRQGVRFVDAHPLHWRLIGAAMAMLPGARVVNCRRDPLEHCFSCYRQLFASGHHFSYDLDDIASYWRDYDKLSRHWLEIFPQRFFEHRYELLLDDPNVQMWCLLDFLDLEFDPACLAFHRQRGAARSIEAAQARRPLQRGIARGEQYGDKLDRLRTLLGIEAAVNQAEEMDG
ncbi:tetratricopeptide repeat-containing sulfotransferase family protein [Rhodanobacter sp. L36]|uniref:tetratricopeptide repeat-containing sulfotransferase family protein n=1 Tax=Rhodanobacter sp. L36 TaxID=1747221 RepID=UPI00131AB6BC|nr:tetratricopeptide repeat-containing sulfotransferase family protein [Rhodanobacter sp. L36]